MAVDVYFVTQTGLSKSNSLHFSVSAQPRSHVFGTHHFSVSSVPQTVPAGHVSPDAHDVVARHPTPQSGSPQLPSVSVPGGQMEPWMPPEAKPGTTGPPVSHAKKVMLASEARRTSAAVW